MTTPFDPLRVVGRFVRRVHKPSGAVPGTLVHSGPRRVETTRITLIEYDGVGLREEVVEDFGATCPFAPPPKVTWVNIDGLHDVGVIRAVGERLGIHPLVLEDIVQVGQRPKLEVHGDWIYVVLPMLDWRALPQTGPQAYASAHVDEEQLSILFGPNWVVTFQERPGDVLDPVRERLRRADGRIRSHGSDYLAYALIDAVVDRWFTVLERLGEEADARELEVMDDPGEDVVRALHHLKRELVAMRRRAGPVREVAAELMRTGSHLVTDDTRVFLRDVHDHAVQIVDAIDSVRDVCSGLMDLYFSTVSNRTNEVMKVLTVMASIFIPLTFVVGVYGMNFEYMPELAIRWAYPAVLAGMFALAVAMLVWFRRKGWL